MRTYSLTQAAKKLQINRQTLLHYHQQGVLEFQMVKPTQFNVKQHYVKGIDEPTMQKLQRILNAELRIDGITIRQFSETYGVSINKVRCFIHNHHLKPIMANNSGIGPRYHLYPKEQLEYLWQTVHNDRQLLEQYNLYPTTAIYYDPDTDMSLPQLNHRLKNLKKIVLKWMQRDQIPYQIDYNYQIYFTPTDQQWIFDHYKHVPTGFIDVPTMAAQLNTSQQTLNSFIQYYRFKHHRVIGDTKRYYDPKTTRLIQDRYRNRRKRRV